MKKLFVIPAGIAVFGFSAVVGSVTLSPGQPQAPAAASMLGAKALIQAEANKPGATTQSVLAALERQQIPAALAVQVAEQAPLGLEPVELAAAGSLDAQQILSDVRQVLLAQAGNPQRRPPPQRGPGVQTITGQTYANLFPEDFYPRLGAGTRNGDGLVSVVTAAAYSGSGGVVSPN